MKDRKVIRMDFTYEYSPKNVEEYSKEGFGSLVIDPELEFWIRVKGFYWNSVDEGYANEIVSYLKGLNKRTYGIKDFESSELKELISSYYEWDMLLDDDYKIFYVTKEIPLSDVKLEDVLETSLPESVCIDEIRDFRILLSLLESGVHLRIIPNESH